MNLLFASFALAAGVQAYFIPALHYGNSGYSKQYLYPGSYYYYSGNGQQQGESVQQALGYSGQYYQQQQQQPNYYYAQQGQQNQNPQQYYQAPGAAATHTSRFKAQLSYVDPELNVVKPSADL